MVREEGRGCGEALVQAEEDEQDKADDEHGDDVARGPARGCGVGEREGEEEDYEARGEEEGAGDCGGC